MRAMKDPALRARLEQALGHLLDALADPRRRGRTVVTVLTVYCVVWTLYAVVAKASQDFHFDMGEMVAWSREITFGTPKHPPLPAWLAGAWFSMFPLAPWAYDLLAVIVAAAALGIAFAVSTRYLDGTKSAIALAFLTLVPFFNFHALKYNANSAMMPWWALTTWFFLRSFEASASRGDGATTTPAAGDSPVAFAALAGIAAAAAMLVKYWTVVLLLAMVIAALCDSRRKAYFTSAAPYVTAAAGVAALSPHLFWLWQHNFTSFGYALESHPDGRFEAFVSGLGYVAGALSYAIIPVVLTAMAARPAPAAIADALWPQTDGNGALPRRLAVLVFFLPLVLPMILAVAASETVVSLWAIGGMTLLPVVLLSSPRIVISRPAAIRIVGVAVAFPLLALLLAPVVAVATHLAGIKNYGDQYSLIADAAGKFWHDATGRPVRLVGSHDTVMNGSVLYFPDRPSTFDIENPRLTPWADDARVARDGALLYCPVPKTECMEAMNRRAAAAKAVRRTEVDISRTFLWMRGPVTRYAIVAILPE